jgi:hypothetical protein
MAVFNLDSASSLLITSLDRHSAFGEGRRAATGTAADRVFTCGVFVSVIPFSLIRTMTVGFGITPNLLTLKECLPQALAGFVMRAIRLHITAGGEFHPAPRTWRSLERHG